jgi:hypothetical protein
MRLNELTLAGAVAIIVTNPVSALSISILPNSTLERMKSLIIIGMEYDLGELL